MASPIVNMHLHVDFTSFKYGLLELAAKAVSGSVQGMDNAMDQFKFDCLEEPPSCPIGETHELYDSHIILPTKVQGHTIIGTLEVRKSYAASLHEGISRWGTAYTYTRAGAGAKWVETKLLRHGRKYMEMVARELHH